MSDTTYLSVADTAKLVRAALREAFPKTKFSVRSHGYSMGASISVKWTDGPNREQVESVAKCFEGSYFDSSIDYKGSVYHMLDGKKVHMGADSISCDREYSDATIERMLARCAREYGCELRSVEDFRKGRLWNVYACNGTNSMHWSIQEVVHRMAAKHTFEVARKSPTAERVEVLGSDRYSLQCGSGKSFGDDDVVQAISRAQRI